MAAKPKSTIQSDAEPAEKQESGELILTQAQHASLSESEKAAFRAKGGTVSNQ